MTASPYSEVILAHAREPRGRGCLMDISHREERSNFLCGDRVDVCLQLHEGRVQHYAFEAEACAFTVAAASMLSAMVEGITADDAALLRAQLEALLSGAADAPVAQLGELNAFVELLNHPSRRRCALLPLDALCAAFDHPVSPDRRNSPA